MPSVPSDTNLSLGKLMRAAKHDTVSNYTTETELGNDCGNTTTANANVSMSDFYMSADSGLTGYAYVDEQTSDTYTLGLSGGGALLTSRIGGNYRNFTWNTSNALFNPTSNQDYTGVFTAGSISNINQANSVGDGTPGTFHAAHTNDTSLTIYGGYDDSIAYAKDGFNDHATRYAVSQSKTVQIEDTYNSSAITCFLPETPVELEDGEIIPIEDLVVGDKVKSFHIENLPDESLGLERYRGFNLEETTGKEGSTVVKNVWFDFNAGYLSINKDLLKVTSEHEFWVLNKSVEPENEYMPPIDRWGFKKAAGLKVGDVLFGKNELIEIESIEWNHTEVEVVNINVEPVDVYFVNNILVHNKGNNNQH